MSSQVKVVVYKRSRKRWAAYGFLLIVALLVISYFLSTPATDFVKALSHGQFRPGAPGGLTKLQVQVAFTLIIFFILGSVAALNVTVAAPKKVINVKETDLVKERLDGVKYHKKAKKRQRTLNREMREYVEKRNSQK